MTTMTLSPDSANEEMVSVGSAVDRRGCPAADRGSLGSAATALRDAAAPVRVKDAGPAMTEEDTVSVLDVLDEMQRIIDRHLEKTAQQQSDR